MPPEVPLSVVIPTYNRAQFLERALLSVLQQSVLPGEIIVVDDGSQDRTAEVVEQIRSIHSLKIIYFRQQNRGPGAARNTGVSLAHHEIIAFLDSDDHWMRRKVELQFEPFTKSPTQRISHTREKWFRRGSHLNQKKIHQPQAGDIFKSCLKLCCVGMSTVMMYRSLFHEYGPFDEQLPCCEDYDFWLRVARKESFLLIEKPLTIKEGGREDQVSARYRIGMDKYRIYSLKKLLDEKQLTSDQAALARTELVKKCSIYGNGCLKHGKQEEGLKILNIAKQFQ